MFLAAQAGAAAAAIAAALIAALAARQPAPLAAHPADPTYAEDVAPILYKNCASCHHPGGIGPFSVLDYDSLSSEIDDIRSAIDERQMPPWFADEPHGVFSNDRRLSDEDRQTILRWIDAGAKPGDLSKLPPKPEFASQWSIGTPDAVYGMQDDFEVPASGTVDYQYFQIPTNLTEDKWVKQIEILPGAREVVHHVLVYAYAPPSARPAMAAVPASAQSGTPGTRPQPVLIRNREWEKTPPEPPRQDSAHAPPRQMGVLIASLAPGTDVMTFPEGTALRLRAGTILTFQMHYTAHGHVMKDRTQIGFKFANEAPREEMFTSAFINGTFKLPAGSSGDSVPSELGVGQPVRLWGLLPHTHLRGTRWRYTLVKPDGSSEVILDVPHYDFNWQTYYMFAQPLELAPGSKIEGMAWYDNSAANKHNPNPNADVWWGDQTWDEMQYTGFMYSVPGRKVQ